MKKFRLVGFGSFCFFAILFCFGLRVHAQQDSLQINSPDGKLNFKFSPSADDKGAILYTVSLQQQDIILPSAMGLISNPQGANRLNWATGCRIADASKRTYKGSWKPVLGEREQVPDHYNELTITLKPKNPSVKGSMQIIVRAYNEGIAFRYAFPQDLSTQILEIGDEKTEFNLPAESRAFLTPKAQGSYQNVPVRDWKFAAELPHTLSLRNNLWISIAQAEQVNFSRMRLKTSAENKLVTQLYGEVVETSPFATPWRVILVADTPGKLLENNYLILNLNPPDKLINADWIKPGKVMREVTLTTAGARKLVDFAVEQNIDFVHFDAGWYGYEYDIASDARAVSNQRANRLDIKEAIQYAAQKGKKVILYVNHRALERQADSLFPLYQSWGVAGVKFGFVHTGSHLWNRWLHDMIRKAADHRLMVDVHDEYYPTGFSRTYPNLMTQEGVLGNEAFPDATHNTILPFTRYIAGAGDYTYCFNFHKLKNTKGHQLALPVIYFSPWQYLYWYGKPEDYPDRSEIGFWKDLPTVWDDTKVLAGTPGEYVAIARRRGTGWYVGVITNTSSREVTIRTSFLEKKKRYQAEIYEDGEAGKIIIDKKILDHSSDLKLSLKASGGAAISIQQL